MLVTRLFVMMIARYGYIHVNDGSLSSIGYYRRWCNEMTKLC